MIVGFDARWHNQSGVGTYVCNLLQELAEIESHDFELIAYEDPNNPVPASGPRIRKSPVRAGKYSIAGQFELALRCHQDRINVFHAPFYIVPLLAKCPVVVTIHDLIPFLFPLYGRVHSEVVKAGYRAAVHKAAKVIAVSQTTVADLGNILAVPQDRISMVYNAYSKRLYFPIDGKQENLYLRDRYGIARPYVLTLSAGNWRTKNLDTALAAIELARSYSGVMFQTVVAGPQEGLRASGMADRVTNLVTTGFVQAEDLPMLYRNASVFVTVSRYEGFGLPLLEAMACGCPCVTSTGGSLPEVAGDAATAFSPSDATGMARTIARLLVDSNYRDELSSRGIRRASEFSYRKTAAETLTIYERITASGR